MEVQLEMGGFTSFLSLFTIGMILQRNGFEMKTDWKEKEEEEKTS